MQVTEQVNTQVPSEKIPTESTLCKILMEQIESTFLTNVRVHAAQNVPASVMAMSLDKLNHLMHQSEAAHQNGDKDQLQSLFDQMRHFDEPTEVKTYHEARFRQSYSPNNLSIHPGNK